MTYTGRYWEASVIHPVETPSVYRGCLAPIGKSVTCCPPLHWDPSVAGLQGHPGTLRMLWINAVGCQGKTSAMRANSNAHFLTRLTDARCTQHGRGSRQASSDEVMEHYHSNVHPRKRHGKEKLYSHDNECKSIKSLPWTSSAWLEKFMEIKFEFIQTVRKSKQCNWIDWCCFLCVTALACSKWVQCPTYFDEVRHASRQAKKEDMT